MKKLLLLTTAAIVFADNISHAQGYLTLTNLSSMNIAGVLFESQNGTTYADIGSPITVDLPAGAVATIQMPASTTIWGLNIDSLGDVPISPSTIDADGNPLFVPGLDSSKNYTGWFDSSAQTAGITVQAVPEPSTNGFFLTMATILLLRKTGRFFGLVSLLDSLLVALRSFFASSAK